MSSRRQCSRFSLVKALLFSIIFIGCAAALPPVISPSVGYHALSSRADDLEMNILPISATTTKNGKYASAKKAAETLGNAAQCAARVATITLKKGVYYGDKVVSVVPVLNHLVDMGKYFAKYENRKFFWHYFKVWMSNLDKVQMMAVATTLFGEGILGISVFKELVMIVDAKGAIPMGETCVLIASALTALQWYRDSHDDFPKWTRNTFPIDDFGGAVALGTVMFEMTYTSAMTMIGVGPDHVKDYLGVMLTHGGFGLLNLAQAGELQRSLGKFSAPDGTAWSAAKLNTLRTLVGLKAGAYKLHNGLSALWGLVVSREIERKELGLDDKKLFNYYRPLTKGLLQQINAARVGTTCSDDTNDVFTINSRLDWFGKKTPADCRKEYDEKHKELIEQAKDVESNVVETGIVGYSFAGPDTTKKFALVKGQNDENVMADLIPNLGLAIFAAFLVWLMIPEGTSFVNVVVAVLGTMWSTSFMIDGFKTKAQAIIEYFTGGPREADFNDWIKKELKDGSLEEYGKDEVAVDALVFEYTNPQDRLIYGQVRYMVWNCARCDQDSEWRQNLEETIRKEAEENRSLIASEPIRERGESTEVREFTYHAGKPIKHILEPVKKGDTKNAGRVIGRFKAFFGAAKSEPAGRGKVSVRAARKPGQDFDPYEWIELMSATSASKMCGGKK